MCCAAQPELDPGDLFLVQAFVAGEANLFGAEAAQIGEQCRRIDLDDELARAESGHADVVRDRGSNRLFECSGHTRTAGFRPDLFQDAAQQIADMARCGHDPLIGIRT